MQLILTHEFADFDAVASQLAAHKLLPAAQPLLPHRLNRNVEQFLHLYWQAYPFRRASDWRASDWRKQPVDSILLVDTQGLNSVRGIVKKPAVRVIDHHPLDKRQDGWIYEVEQVGATATLLVEKLSAQGMALSPEEATLMLLGIYEDTGSLTYDATTVRDITAAAWLLEQGGVLQIVRRFIAMPLSQGQQALYEKLLTAVVWHEIDGQQIAIASTTVDANFDEQISAVAHQLRETLNAAGLLVLVQIDADVQLVARSTRDEVDVGQIAHELGGGGHKRAAAALIPQQTLTAVTQQILTLLPQAVQPQARVADIMSSRAQTIAADTAVRAAQETMMRSGHEGYPVIAGEPPRLVGLLTRPAVDRAMAHHMGNTAVHKIMKEGTISIRPADSVQTLQKLIMEAGWGQIPVVANNAAPDALPIGIVTRTDLLNHLFGTQPQTAVPRMRQQLQSWLPSGLWRLVDIISKTAASLNMPLYFVGGPVRDLLLGQPPTDLDMVVEGDAIALALALADKYGGDTRSHQRFGTANWALTPAVWQAIAAHADDAPPLDAIDLVTARTEFYVEPTALPTVSQSSIKLDLHRRDFSINTLALRLDGQHMGELLDFYGGQRDLADGVIRVLHSLSFSDDPTRILRAVRFEQRLDFRLEPRTAQLLTAALPLLKRVSGARLRHEFELAFREQHPAPIMARLAELDVLAHIQADLMWPDAAAVSFNRAPQFLADAAWQQALGRDTAVFVYFALWMLPLPQAVQAATMRRLRARNSTQQQVQTANAALTRLHALPDDAPPSRIEKTLRPVPEAVLLVLRIHSADTREATWLDRYVNEWRGVKTAVSGHDLRQMGLQPGPHFATILDALLAARLNGRVADDAAEWALLAALIAEFTRSGDFSRNK